MDEVASGALTRLAVGKTLVRPVGLGPILIQLPPFLKADENLLSRFLSATRSVISKVFEFRHPSWFVDRVYRLLEEHEAGFCVAETEDLKPEFKVTGDLAYYRLRKDSYNGEAVDRWAERIMGASKGARECYAFLRHDESGENALLAQRLSRGLEQAA